MSRFKIGNIKGPKGDKGETGAVGPKGEQGIQGPAGPAGGVDSVNGMTGDVTVEDTQGVNLLTGTRDFNGSAWENLSYWTINGVYDGFTVLKRSESFQAICQTIPVKKDETFTFSAFIKGNGNTISLETSVGNKATAVTNTKNLLVVADENWKRVSFTFKIITAGDIRIGIETSTTYAEVEVCGLKLERGAVTNPIWTPSPYDTLLKGEVDGRNLFAIANSVPGWIDDANVINIPLYGELTSDWITVVPNEQISARVLETIGSSTDSFWLKFVWYNMTKEFMSVTAFKENLVINTFYDISKTVTVPENAAYLRVSVKLYDDGKIKVERGTIATHWTPAPEDVVVRSELDNFFNPAIADDLFDYALNQTSDFITFVKTNSNTSNTPYKLNLTPASIGMAVILKTSNYITILFIGVSDNRIFVTRYDAKKWLGWMVINPMELLSANVMESDLETASADETTDDDTEIN